MDEAKSSFKMRPWIAPWIKNNITDWGKIKSEIKDSLGDFCLERDKT